MIITADFYGNPYKEIESKLKNLEVLVLINNAGGGMEGTFLFKC